MTGYFLSHGKHATAKDGRCAMEWVSYLAGEVHSDEPACVSRVLRRFCIAFNDGLDDESRQRLRPYLARTIGTAGDGLDEQRLWMTTDWAIRTYVPTWLSLAGFEMDATRLRDLPSVFSVENLNQAMKDLDAAGSEALIAWSTAWTDAWAAGGVVSVRTDIWAAAGNAVREVVWAATETAVRDIAGDAVRKIIGDTAWVAAGVAARVAAKDAAENKSVDAAGVAARQVLIPTTIELRESAFKLLDRMLPGEIIQFPVVENWRKVCELA